MDSALELTPPRPLRARPITRIDRGAVGRLVLGVLALVLAYIAQGFLEGRAFAGDAALVLIVGAVLFTRSSAGTVAPTLDAAPVPLPALRVARRLHPGLVVLAAGALANLVGLFVFLRAWAADRAPNAPGNLQMPNVAWALYLLSVAVALVGVYLLDARPSLRRLLRRNALVLSIVGVIGLVALVLRIYRLGELPFGMWADEAYNGLEVWHIMRDPLYRPVVGGGASQGLPAMFWYLMVPFFAIVGPTQLALRLPIALAGTAGIVAVFLLGRALFGRAVGLVAAALLSTMAWHLTFSRISFNGIFSTTLDALSLAFLVAGIKTGRRSLFALGGLCLGLGQNFYFGSRLFVAVAGIYLFHQMAIHRLPWLRRHLIGLGLFALFAAISASPITVYALAYPKEFNERATTVSVFREVQEQHSYQPLFDNIRKHLLMFNLQGDSNGRHNLPGAPMLEQATATLVVAGFALALVRAVRPEYFALLAWWLVMLQGGILSLAFEAPQAYRTIDEVIVVALFAAIPLVSIGQRIYRLGGGARARLAGFAVPAGGLVAALLTTIVVVGIGIANVQRYFVRQANNASVWAAHATPESIIGREIATGRTIGQVYLDPILLEQPTIKFLAPQYTPHVRYDAARMLPLRDPVGATIFLHAEQSSELATVRRIYPDATVREYRNPAGGPPILYEVLVPPDQVTRIQGAEARLWAGTSADGEPATNLRNQTIALSADSAPLPTPFLAEWRAVLAAPTFGRYAFRLEGPPEANLSLDETELTSGGVEAGVTLARGNHTLQVRTPIAANVKVQLLWRTPGDAEYAPVPREALFSPPVTNNGLLGSYYKGPSWTGEPAIQQIDPSLQIRIHLLPLERPYSVEWKGKIYVPTNGTYRFGTASRDESWLFVDERMVVDNSRGTGEYVEGALILTPGFHDIRIRFLDHTGHTFLNTFWTPPGKAREPVPTEYLFPPQGAYPDKVLPPPPPLVPAAPAAAPAAQTVPQSAAGAPAAKPAEKPVASQPGVPANTPRLAVEPLLTIGGPGDGLGQLNQPRGVAVDKNGNIYVADTANHRVQKFDPSGKPTAAWGTASDLIEPLGVVVDSSGRVIVLDSEPGWLKRYTPEGQLVDQFGGPDARFYHPRGLAIDAADNVYVADTGGGRVVKFNGKGEQVAVIGTKGRGPGQIAEPTGVAADPRGVWIADSANSKLVRYGASGSADVELPIGKAGSFNGPHGVPTEDGGVILSDPESGRLVVFGPDGLAKSVIEVPGLRRPVGLAMAPDGRIVIGDVELQQVLVLPAATG